MLVPTFFGLYFMIATALTRMRAELGPPLHAIVLVNPQVVLVSAFGTRQIGAPNLTMFSLFYWFNRLNRSHPMPHQLEAFKSAEGTGVNTHRLTWAMMLSLIFGVLLAFWIFPVMLYRYGASTAGELLAAGAQACNSLSGWLQNPKEPDTLGAGIIGGSAIFSIIMGWMRMRFIWFPFHPAGYILGISSGTIDVYWFALFVCWAITADLKARWGDELSEGRPILHGTGGWRLHRWHLLGIAEYYTPKTSVYNVVLTGQTEERENGKARQFSLPFSLFASRTR